MAVSDEWRAAGSRVEADEGLLGQEKESGQETRGRWEEVGISPTLSPILATKKAGSGSPLFCCSLVFERRLVPKTDRLSDLAHLVFEFVNVFADVEFPAHLLESPLDHAREPFDLFGSMSL